MTFPIVVEIDPSRASRGSAGARAVEQTLAGLEARGKQAGTQLGASLADGIGDGGARGLESLTAQFRRLTALGAGAFGVKTLVSYADEFTNLQNRLGAVIDDQTRLGEVSDRLFDVAQETGSAWAATAEIFVRTSGAVKELGLTEREVISFTEDLSKAVKLSGASAAEANAAMIQLSQGLASGTLRGDELRSVLEQLPTVADVIADHLGVTRGQLRQMGADGQITAETIINAFQEAGPEIDEQFGRRVPTLGESFTKLKNSAVRAMEGIVPAIQLVIPVLDLLATGIRTVGDAIGTVTGVVGDAVDGFKDFVGVGNDIPPTMEQAEQFAAAFHDEIERGNDFVAGMADALRNQAEGAARVAEITEQVRQGIEVQTDSLAEQIIALAAAEEGWSTLGAAMVVPSKVQQDLDELAAKLSRLNDQLAGGVIAKSQTVFVDRLGDFVVESAKHSAFLAKAYKADFIDMTREVERGAKESLRIIEQERERAAAAAARDHEDFIGRVTDLARAAQPTRAAVADLALAEDDLNRAFAEGVIGLDSYNRILEATRASYQDAIDPVQAYLDATQQEIDLLRLSREERELAIEVQKAEEAARAAGGVGLLKQIELMQRAYDLQQARREASERDNAKPGELIDPYGDDVASSKELREEVKALGEQSAESADLIASSFEAAWGAAQSALDEFLRTGKFSLRSFVDDVLSELGRIAAQRIGGGGGGGLGELLGFVPKVLGEGGSGGGTPTGIFDIDHPGLGGPSPGAGGGGPGPGAAPGAGGGFALLRQPSGEALHAPIGGFGAAVAPRAPAPRVVNNVVLDARKLGIGIVSTERARREYVHAVLDPGLRRLLARQK